MDDVVLCNFQHSITHLELFLNNKQMPAFGTACWHLERPRSQCSLRDSLLPHDQKLLYLLNLCALPSFYLSHVEML